MDKAKILYVDDEIINLKLFETVLKRNFLILTALNGYSGLELLQENPDIQVVISDMKMPNMSGLEFIRQASQIAPNVNYYILTGFEITNQIQEALDQGMIRKYFRKPTNLNEIASEIDSVVREN